MHRKTMNVKIPLLPHHRLANSLPSPEVNTKNNLSDLSYASTYVSYRDVYIYKCHTFLT